MTMKITVMLDDEEAVKLYNMLGNAARLYNVFGEDDRKFAETMMVSMSKLMAKHGLLPSPYRPNGILFKEPGNAVQLLLSTQEGNTMRGWVFYQNVDGQWVSLRKATDHDKAIVYKLIHDVNRDSEPGV